MKAKQLTIPIQYNADVVNKWVGDAEILQEFSNEDNYCLFVSYTGNHYQFIRFFTLRHKTVVSVDFNGSQQSVMEKFAELLNEKN